MTAWNEIGEHLIFIERGAEMAGRHVGYLFERPDWETLAENELEHAEKVLAERADPYPGGQGIVSKEEKRCLNWCTANCRLPRSSG